MMNIRERERERVNEITLATYLLKRFSVLVPPLAINIVKSTVKNNLH